MDAQVDPPAGGRILRQGNLNPEVEILRYVTAGSSDAYRWQKIEQKAAAADQVLSGTGGSRSTEDVDGVQLDYAEIKAIASGNPLVMERTKLQAQVQRYQALQRVHQTQQFEAQQGLEAARQELAALRESDPAAERIPALTEEMAQHRATLQTPFEYEEELAAAQAGLAGIDREIARLNRPASSKRGGLLARLFGGRT